MHNDIFLGLLGLESDLFISCENTSVVLTQFKLNPSICCLHPGEYNILEKLCSLANSYSVYYNFTSSENSFLRAPGLYLQAFKHGLLEIMCRYRQAVLELEKERKRTHLFPLSHLVHALDEYFSLFPAIDGIILDIFQSKRAHGCILLDIVAKRINVGDAKIKFAIQQLYCKLQSILFRQISIWCIHGLICDMHKEFFIYSTIPESAFDDHAPSVIGESYGKLCKEGISSKSQFEIQKALLPTCISQKLADTILFVGEAVYRFSFSINSKISVENDLLYSFNETGLLSEYEQEFNDHLRQMLSQNYFWKQRLEREMEFLKSKVNNGIVSLIYKKGNILSQLRLIKDFFLLGSGEFFILFLDTILEKDSQLNQLKERDINDIFIQLFNSFQHERSLTRFPIQFRITTDSPNLPFKLITCFQTLINIQSESDVLGKCILSCSIDWPLQVLLDSRVISQYQLIFNYLLKIRRAHVCLLEVWKNYRKKSYSSSSSPKGGSLWTMWEIHYQMRFFLDSLQYYVFSDVIEVQYNIFLRKIHNLKDFETLSLMHEEFLDIIIDKLFITSDKILPAILHILELVERLLKLFQEGSRLVSFQFNLLKTQFNLKCQDFYKKFNFQESHPNPNLSIFLMRMDYNQFYSKLLNSPESIKVRLEVDSK